MSAPKRPPMDAIYRPIVELSNNRTPRRLEGFVPDYIDWRIVLALFVTYIAGGAHGVFNVYRRCPASRHLCFGR